LPTLEADALQLSMIDFVMKSGRALMFPVYKDTYERLGTIPDAGTNAERAEIIQQTNDMRRSMITWNAKDIQHAKAGVLRNQWGGELGSILTAMEKRFHVAVLWLAMRYVASAAGGGPDEFCAASKSASADGEWKV